MTTENKEIVSVDGKDYTVEDMTPEQQYIIAQVKNINSKKQNISRGELINQLLHAQLN